MEASQVQTIRLGDASVGTLRASFERWIAVAKCQERLTLNRAEELKLKKFRNQNIIKQKKNRDLVIRERWIKHYIKIYRNGEMTTRMYWDKIVEIKKDFNITGKMK